MLGFRNPGRPSRAGTIFTGNHPNPGVLNSAPHYGAHNQKPPKTKGFTVFSYLCVSHRGLKQLSTLGSKSAYFNAHARATVARQYTYPSTIPGYYEYKNVAQLACARSARGIYVSKPENLGGAGTWIFLVEKRPTTFTLIYDP